MNQIAPPGPTRTPPGAVDPFGHDPGPDGRRSLILQRYRTGGTPWTVIIDRAGVVRYNDFFIAPKDAVALIQTLKNDTI